MKGPTNGWQLLCVVVLLATATTAVGAAQSTETTANTTETPSKTPTTVAATTMIGAESPTSTETPLATTVANNGTTTSLDSPTRTPGSDQAEDNVPANATPIEIGETVTGRLPVGDQDWTQFSLESGGELTVSITAQNETSLSAFIYSSENRLERTYVDPGEQVRLTAAADSAGQYYVFIRNEANDTAGSYAFEVSKSETATSEPTEDTTENTDGSGGGLGFWAFGLLGAVVLVGYLSFRREGELGEEEEVNESGEEENGD